MLINIISFELFKQFIAYEIVIKRDLMKNNVQAEIREPEFT